MSATLLASASVCAVPSLHVQPFVNCVMIVCLVIACLVMMIACLVIVCVEVASGWLIAFVRSFFVFLFLFWCMCMIMTVHFSFLFILFTSYIIIGGSAFRCAKA